MRKAALLLSLVLLLSVAPVSVLAQSESPAESDVQEIIIFLNGQPVELEQPVIVKDGRVFVPVREFAPLFDATAEWNGETREVAIDTSSGDALVFAMDEPRLSLNGTDYFMDVEPFIEDGKAYIPLRHAAEFMHAKVEWREDLNTIELTTIPVFYYTGVVGIEHIAAQLEVELDLLLERNGLGSVEEIAPDTYLKIWIPDIMRNKLDPPPKTEVSASAVRTYTEEDLLLLAKLVQVEAGYEPYEGQVAVANVVLNRVADSRFPDTIRDVIYAPGQFPPAHNGKLDNTVPGESAMRAAEAALNGEVVVEGALYFYNPKVSGGSYWNRLTLVKQIGNHRFMK